MLVGRAQRAFARSPAAVRELGRNRPLLARRALPHEFHVLSAPGANLLRGHTATARHQQFPRPQHDVLRLCPGWRNLRDRRLRCRHATLADRQLHSPRCFAAPTRSRGAIRLVARWSHAGGRQPGWQTPVLAPAHATVADDFARLPGTQPRRAGHGLQCGWSVVCRVRRPRPTRALARATPFRCRHLPGGVTPTRLPWPSSRHLHVFPTPRSLNLSRIDAATERDCLSRSSGE